MSLLRQALESALISLDEKLIQAFRRSFPPKMALEERADGKADTEIEHTIYARVTNMADLKKAISMEHHEQWEVKVPKQEDNAGEGSIRVRKTWIDGASPTYTRATKIKVGNEGDKKEIPSIASEDEFVGMKFLSNGGMIKDRYHFPVVGSDLVWEVDMFPKEGGGYHDWCKIDLEVSDRSAPLPEFPIALEDVILPKSFGKMDESEWDEKVTKLYNQFFITGNAFLDKTVDKINEAENSNTGEQAATEPKPVDLPSDPKLNTQSDETGGGTGETPETPEGGEGSNEEEENANA